MNRFLYLIFIFLLACGTQKIAEYEDKSVRIDSSLAEGNLDSLIDPYREAMEEEMNQVIGEATVALEKSVPESPLGNFAAEATYLAGVAYGSRTKDVGGPNAMIKSFALLNYGGLRAPISKGDITIGNMYELMPFDNTLVLVKLSGEQVRACAKYLFGVHGQPVYNARFRLSSNSETMWIGEKEYNFDEEIIVITSNYLADGGDNMTFFNEPLRKWDSGIFLRDIFIDYVKEKKVLGRYPTTGKFHFVKTGE